MSAQGLWRGEGRLRLHCESVAILRLLQTNVDRIRHVLSIIQVIESMG